MLRSQLLHLSSLRLPTLIIIAGLSTLLSAVIFSTDNPSVFINVPGLAIILGGVSTALLFSYSAKEIMQAFRKVSSAKNELPIDKVATIKRMTHIAELWVRNDFRSIEKVLDDINDPFFQTGIQHIIDRRPESEIVSVLSWKTHQFRSAEYRDARIFNSMATFAPAFGMVGTLLGLVNMMFLMDDQTNSSIASHLAIALVTTFYGLILANLFFKPIATKIERKADKQVEWMGIVMEGILMIEQRKSPSFIKNMMNILDPFQESEVNDSRTSVRAEPLLNAR